MSEEFMYEADQASSVEAFEREGPVYSEVELPSNGKLGYPATVMYRDILVKDEKQIASANTKNFDVILNQVLKGLLKDQTFYDRMSTHDRDYLLLWIWANSYTPVKTIEHICPHCEKTNQYQINVTELTVKDLEAEVGELPYKFVTSSGKEVSLRLFTVAMEKAARTMKINNPKENYDELFLMICQSIDFGKVIPLKEKIKIIEEEFSGKDMATIRGFHAHYRYGVDDTLTKTCSSCGEVSSFSFPFRLDFFLPTVQDDFRKTV